MGFVIKFNLIVTIEVYGSKILMQLSVQKNK